MTKFSENHMGNSPVKQLGKNRADRLIKRAQKRSERGGETGGYNYSDKKVVKLLDRVKKLKNKKSSKSYGEDTRVSMSFERPDFDSMLNMDSPLNQGGYVGGGMSASDYQPTADLYMNMFKGIAEGAEKYDANVARKNAKEECEGKPNTPTGMKYKKITDSEGNTSMSCVKI